MIEYYLFSITHQFRKIENNNAYFWSDLTNEWKIYGIDNKQIVLNIRITSLKLSEIDVLLYGIDL